MAADPVWCNALSLLLSPSSIPRFTLLCKLLLERLYIAAGLERRADARGEAAKDGLSAADSEAGAPYDDLS